MSINLGGRTIDLGKIAKRATVKNIGAVIGSRLYVELKGIVEALLGGKVAGHEEFANWLINVLVNEALDEVLQVRSPTMIRFKDAILDGALGAMYYDLLSTKAPSLAELLAMGLSETETAPPPQTATSNIQQVQSTSPRRERQPVLAEARVW